MDLFAVWGKTRRREGQVTDVHPLICHMVDVAEVTGALWDRSLGAGLRARVTRALGCSEDEARRTLMFWAALHDLGKASPAFQRRHPPAVPLLEQEGLSFRRQFYGTDEGAWHGLITASTLPALLEARGVSRLLARDLARGLGGHHGTWPTSLELQDLNRDDCGGAAWDAARAGLVDTLAALYPSVVDEGQLAAREPRQAFIALFSGLVSMADWIGSMEKHFPAAPEAADAASYRLRAAQQAACAVHAVALDAWQAPYTPAAFESLFPEYRPNSVQAQIASLAQSLSGPSLVLIEAPTGYGKTEAALHLADTLAATQHQRGLYVAMPTTATSNAMYERVTAMLNRRYGEGAVTPLLVHSQALWRDPPPEISSSQEAEGEGGGAHQATVRDAEAMSWFLPRKRSLLAPFGVGTVDQALLSVLLTRHFFVRLFGLAHKTVVFDEVHAYDTYMSTIFARLLEWLRAEGTSVILLSATLPAVTRQALFAAWGVPMPEPAKMYPAITYASGGLEGVRAAEPPVDRVVHLGWLEHTPEALLETLRESLQEGGCAAVLCNTVGRAQDVYRMLKGAHLLPEEDLALFHARYPLAWRREIEQSVGSRYGKGDDKGPRRGIVVATQVIEQSLDLDFDLMVSDLAPMDLLLQRAGRLHRHPGRVRPVALAEPRLLLVEPQEIDALPDWGSDAYVYEPYILLRTWLALQGRNAWHLPSETRALIEAVYGEGEPAAEGALAEALARYRLAWEQGQREDAQKASRYLVLPVCDEDLLRQRNPMLTEEDPEVHPSMRAQTRLGDPGLQVVCLRQTAAGPATLASGGVFIDLSRPPTDAETAHLAQCIVQVSHRGLVTSLLAAPPPRAWRHSSLLRHARYVVFDERSAQVAGPGGRYLLQLTREEGLRVERQ